MSEDKNFDSLFDRFKRNIKVSPKGLLRETLIREDLEGHVLGFQKRQLEVLDAGCGLGDMSLWLASKGHRVSASDISAKMVQHTQSLILEHKLSDQINVSQEALQSALSKGQRYDLICIHAVVEWLASPYDIVRLLPESLKPGGQVSITVYNLHRSIFNSLIKGNFHKVRSGNFAGGEHSLTPPNPIEPEKMHAELTKAGLSVELQAGLRCFYDYLSPQIKEERSFDDVLLLERRYRKKSPYRDMARYVHFIAKF